jgi:WD40 repeat protein
VVKSLQHKDRTRGLAWRGDGKLLAVACGPRIAVWEADAERLLGQWEGHESEVIGVAFSQRGDRLASSSWETFTRLWDVATGRQLMSTTGGHGHVYALQFAADDQRLGYALEGPNLGLWEVAPGHECRILVGRLGPGRGSWGGDFSPDGRLVALADRDALRLWDVAAGEEIGSVPEECWAVCFARDGKALLTTGAQGLKSWPLDDNPARHDEAHAKRDPARTMRIGPAKSLREGLPLSRACLSDDGQLLVATVPTPQTAALIVPLDDPSRSVVLKDRQDFLVISLSPDKRWVASGSFYSRGVKIWDAQSGKVVRELATPWATTVAFSPDGGTLVTCTRDEYVFWDVKSWQPRRVVERHEVAGVPGMMDFAPDGKTLAIAHNPSLVQLRDVATGDQLATLEGPSRHEVGWLRFSRDGARLAVGCANGQVHVWDLRMVRQQLAARGLDWQE